MTACAAKAAMDLSISSGTCDNPRGGWRLPESCVASCLDLIKAWLCAPASATCPVTDPQNWWTYVIGVCVTHSPNGRMNASFAAACPPPPQPPGQTAVVHQGAASPPPLSLLPSPSPSLPSSEELLAPIETESSRTVLYISVCVVAVLLAFVAGYVFRSREVRRGK